MVNTMTEDELLKEIRIQVAEHETYRTLAKKWKVSKSYLWDIVHGRRRAGKKILRAMGMRRQTEVVTYITRVDAK